MISFSWTLATPTPATGTPATPIDPSDLEDALQRALVFASGLPPADVIHGHQEGSGKTGAYLTFSIGMMRGKGLPEDRLDYDESRDHQEFELTKYQEQNFTIELRWHATKTTGDLHAVFQLGRTKQTLELQGAQDILDTVGVVIFGFGDVLNMTKLFGADFAGQAMLELTARCQQTVSEFATYMASATLYNRTTEKLSTLDLDD